MAVPFYIEQLRLIAAVTEMLNAAGLPDDPDFHIHVELRETSTNTTVGSWSDEIAGDCWSFSEVAA